MTDPARRRGRCGVLPAVLFAALVSFDGRLRAQDPEPEPEREAEAPVPPEAPAKPEPVVAIRAGTLHPIHGPEIKDGVIVIRGERIVAVGPASAVEIPAGAELLEYPQAHAYPGLVDPLSQAFAPRSGDGIADAGGEMALALDASDERSRALVSTGVTTAYVASRSANVWRGQGVLLHLGQNGPTPFPEHAGAGVHLKLSAQDGPSHALARIERLAGLGTEFEQLEAYEKSFTEHATKLADYEKKFTAWIDWHKQKNGKPASGETPAAPRGGAANGAGEGAPRGERGERGGRGTRRGPGGERTPGGENPTPQNPAPQNPPPQNPAPSTPTQPPNPQTPGATPAVPTPAPAEEKPPERPQYPPQPPRDPAKDALLALRDGKLALFVEVDRAEEVTRALELARQHGVKRLVLELATRAADAVAAIAEAGVPVVVAGSELPPIAELGEGAERRAIAALLAERGVPIAIGSASVERARHLPSIAAEAVGAGVPEDVALRALTIDAAELLGVARDCGSLEPGKLGDVILTSAPLLASESRVLRVLSAGRTVHEVK